MSIVELPVPHEVELRYANRTSRRRLQAVARLPFRIADMRTQDCPVAVSALTRPGLWADCTGRQTRNGHVELVHTAAPVMTDYRVHPSGVLMRPVRLCDRHFGNARDATAEVVDAGFAPQRSAFVERLSSPFRSAPVLEQWADDAALEQARAQSSAETSTLTAARNRLAHGLSQGAAFVDGVLHVQSQGPCLHVVRSGRRWTVVVEEELGHVPPQMAHLAFGANQADIAARVAEELGRLGEGYLEAPPPAMPVVREPLALPEPDTARTMTAMACRICNVAEGWEHWLSMPPDTLHAVATLLGQARHGQRHDTDELMRCADMAVEALARKDRYGPCWMDGVDPATVARVRLQAEAALQPAPELRGPGL